MLSHKNILIVFIIILYLLFGIYPFLYLVKNFFYIFIPLLDSSANKTILFSTFYNFIISLTLIFIICTFLLKHFWKQLFLAASLDFFFFWFIPALLLFSALFSTLVEMSLHSSILAKVLASVHFLAY